MVAGLPPHNSLLTNARFEPETSWWRARFLVPDRIRRPSGSGRAFWCLEILGVDKGLA